jgi:hypothetical protein
MPPRPFPLPWSAELTPNCFIVRDNNGQALAYVFPILIWIKSISLLWSFMCTLG